MCIIIMPNYRNYARGWAFVSSIRSSSSDRDQIQIGLSGTAFFHSLLGLTSSMIPKGEIVACSATLQFTPLTGNAHMWMREWLLWFCIFTKGYIRKKRTIKDYHRWKMSKFGGAAQGEEVKEVKEVKEVTEVEQVRMDVTVLHFSGAYWQNIIG